MKKRQFFWYPRDIEAFEKDTAHLNCTEVGCYDRLLDHYYKRRGRVVANATDLLRICRATCEAEQVACARVVTEFFGESDGKLTHDRADAEIEKAFAISDKRRLAGVRGAAKTHGKQRANGVASGVANATTNGPAIGDTPYTLHSNASDTSLRSVSAADAARMTKDEVWSVGREMLTRQGLGPKTCGSYLGHLIKHHGEESVLAKLRTAIVEQPADLRQWLKAALQKQAVKRAARASTLQAMYPGEPNGPSERDVTPESRRVA